MVPGADHGERQEPRSFRRTVRSDEPFPGAVAVWSPGIRVHPAVRAL